MLDQFAHSIVGWLAPENARNDWWDSYSKNKNAWKYATVGLGGAAIGGLLHQLSGAGKSSNNGGGSSMLSWMLPLGLLAVGGKYMMDRFGNPIKRFITSGGNTMKNVEKTTENTAKASADVATMTNAWKKPVERVGNFVDRAIDHPVQTPVDAITKRIRGVNKNKQRAADAQQRLERERRGEIPNLQPVPSGTYLTPEQILERNRIRKADESRIQGSRSTF